MIPVARRVARTGRGELAVFRLLNRFRGWDTTHTPVHDACWAIAEGRILIVPGDRDRIDGLAAAFAAETPLGDDVDGARSQRARAA